MHSWCLYPFGVLIVFIGCSLGMPCSTHPEEGCSSCTEWHSIEVGHVFCKYHDVIVDKKYERVLKCERMKRKQKICIEAKIGRPRCTKTITLQKSISISDVRKQFGLNRRQFLELNKGVDIDASLEKQRGLSVCVEGKYPSSCRNMYSTDGTESCGKVASKWGIELKDFIRWNNEVKCKDSTPLPKTLVCVEDSLCSYSHTVTSEDSCPKLRKAFKLSEQELLLLNPSIQCDSLVVGTRVCVWPNSRRPVPLMECDGRYLVKSNDSCLTITLKTGTPIDELLFLNPSLECSHLPVGKRICKSGASSTECVRTVNIPPDVTCAQLFVEHAAASSEIFFWNNPLVQCDKLNETQQICGGTGYFEARTCSSYNIVYHKNWTISRIIESPPFNGDSDKFYQLNPKCPRSPTMEFSVGELVCVRPRDADLSEKLRTIASAVSLRSALIMDALYQYEVNPSYTTENDVKYTFTKEIKKIYVYSFLKYQYSFNATMKRMLSFPDEENRRNRMCKAFQKSTSVNRVLKECFCGHEELFVYCDALFMDQYANFNATTAVAVPSEREKRTRVKRFTCTFDIGGFNILKFNSKDKKKSPGASNSESGSDTTKKSEKESKKEEKKNEFQEKYDPDKVLATGRKHISSIFNKFCIEAGCTFPMGQFFELKLAGGGCMNPLDAFSQVVEYFRQPGRKATDALSADLKNYLSLTVSFNLFFRISFCFIGSDILKTFGISGCFVIIQITWFWAVQLLQVAVIVDFEILTLTITVNFKTGDVLPYWDHRDDENLDKSVCSLPQFRCKDYCIWRRNGVKGFFESTHGAAQLDLNAVLFSMNIFKIPFFAPKSDGCNPGDKPFIVITNYRKCDTYVHVVCTSRPAGHTWFAVPDTKSWSSFTEKKHVVMVSTEAKLRIGESHSFIVENTVFEMNWSCSFTSMNKGGEVPTIDVYGGDQGPPRIKVPHYFELQDNEDDTITYHRKGKSKIIVGKLKAKYCDDHKWGKPDNAEPQGISDVPAAKCGRRRVFFSSKLPLGKNHTARVINAFSHIISQDIKLDWDEKTKKIEYDPIRSRLFRENVRWAANATFLLYTINVNQPFFLDEDIFEDNLYEYVQDLVTAIPMLLIDGVDLSKTSMGEVSENDVARINFFLFILQQELEILRETKKRKNIYFVTFSDDSLGTTKQLMDFNETKLLVEFFTFGPGFASEWTRLSKLDTVCDLMGQGVDDLKKLSFYLRMVEELICQMGADKINMFYIPDSFNSVAACMKTAKFLIDHAMCIVTYDLRFLKQTPRPQKKKKAKSFWTKCFEFLADTAEEYIINPIQEAIPVVGKLLKFVLEKTVDCVSGLLDDIGESPLAILDKRHTTKVVVQFLFDKSKERCVKSDDKVIRTFEYTNYTDLVNRTHTIHFHGLGIAFRGLPRQEPHEFITFVRTWDPCMKNSTVANGVFCASKDNVTNLFEIIRAGQLRVNNNESDYSMFNETGFYNETDFIDYDYFVVGEDNSSTTTMTTTTEDPAA